MEYQLLSSTADSIAFRTIDGETINDYGVFNHVKNSLTNKVAVEADKTVEPVYEIINKNDFTTYFGGVDLKDSKALSTACAAYISATQ